MSKIKIFRFAKAVMDISSATGRKILRSFLVYFQEYSHLQSILCKDAQVNSKQRNLGRVSLAVACDIVIGDHSLSFFVCPQ